AERRACAIRISGASRWIAAEDAGRYRDALGAIPPPGLPEAFLEAVAEPMEGLLRRWARAHVPVLAVGLAAPRGPPPGEVEQVLRRLAVRGDLVAGAFRHGVSEREYCHPEVLRTLRRRSLAALRREAEPVPAGVLARFLPGWHGVGSQAGGSDRLLDCVSSLQGLALPASVIERDVLGSRAAGYPPSLHPPFLPIDDRVYAAQPHQQP